jgi:hypothetical protein
MREREKREERGPCTSSEPSYAHDYLVAVVVARIAAILHIVRVRLTAADAIQNSPQLIHLALDGSGIILILILLLPLLLLILLLLLLLLLGTNIVPPLKAQFVAAVPGRPNGRQDAHVGGKLGPFTLTTRLCHVVPTTTPRKQRVVDTVRAQGVVVIDTRRSQKRPGLAHHVLARVPCFRCVPVMGMDPMVKRWCVLDTQDESTYGEQSVKGTKKVVELGLDVWHQATTSPSPFGQSTANVPASLGVVRQNEPRVWWWLLLVFP